MDGRPLSNTVGTVLDPVFALRCRVRVPPGATVRIAFWTVVASSAQRCARPASTSITTPTPSTRAATLAWTQAQVQLQSPRHRSRMQANLFQRLAGHVLYADRVAASVVGCHPPRRRRARGALGSGHFRRPADRSRCGSTTSRTSPSSRQLLRAHEYWRMKQLAVDLVILNERASSYVQDLQVALETLRPHEPARDRRSQRTCARGSVFVLRADLISTETRALLLSVARAVLAGTARNARRIRSTVSRKRTPRPCRRTRAVKTSRVAQMRCTPVPRRRTLEFFNGLGGFAADGREYVTILQRPGGRLPAPWINVIANPAFGFQVAVEGSGYTWARSSRENQLTPWSNDPVTDRPGEVIYLRDEETGELWGPTAAPIRDAAAFYCRHATARATAGSSTTRTVSHSISCMYVPLEDPIKISRLTIRNTSGRARDGSRSQPMSNGCSARRAAASRTFQS